MKRDKARITWVHDPTKVIGRMKGLVPGAFCPRYWIDSWNPSCPDEGFALFVPDSSDVFCVGDLLKCVRTARTHRRRYLQWTGS